MDVQTAVVAALVIGALAYLVARWARALRAARAPRHGGGCGSGCGCGR